MGSKGFETAQSLERYLNRGVLFVQGLDPTATKNEVIQILSQVCKQPQQGRIDILQAPDGRLRGTAFINFHNREDAKAALEKWRFALELHGRQLKMQYSSDREFKDVIQGPHAARFKVLVRNLPEEFDAEAIFEKFTKYGEILQVHTAGDHQGGNYAILQYVEVASVPAAIKGSHREKVLNHVITVEPYRPNAPFGTVPRAVSNYPANGAAAASTSRASGSSSGAGLQGMTFAALQQQQELEQERERQQQQGNDYAGFGVAFGDYGGDSSQADAAGVAEASVYGNGPAASPVGGPAASTSPNRATGIMAPIPSFYAAPPAGTAAAVTAVGSLASLLTAALDHVRLLDEQLCCPITQEPLVDPVVAADGNTYERIAIQAWLDNHDTSPLTNETLPNKFLIPNNLIRNIMEDLKGRANGGALPAPGAATSGDVTVAAVAPSIAPVAATPDGVSDIGILPAAEPAAPTLPAEALPNAEAEVLTVVPVAANVVPPAAQYQYMPYTGVDPVTGQVQIYQAQPYGMVRYPSVQAEQQAQQHQATPAHPAHLMAHMARQQQQQRPGMVPQPPPQPPQPFHHNIHAQTFFAGSYRPSGM